MKIRFFAIVLFIICLGVCNAQEFHCAVSVNSQKLTTTTQQYESSDKKVFESMKQALEDFVNTRKWTNLDFDPNEQIDCTISLILTERSSATDFVGQLSIQMRRPVWNSSYTTGLFNYMEQANLDFSFNESQPLDFDPNTFYSNLSSSVAYYLYIMLGIYFDSYALNGGQQFYEMANTIAQTASTSKYKGWRSDENQKARFWFQENHNNSAYADLHQAYYSYHRLGLDMMTRNQPEARRAIINALNSLKSVHQARSNVLSVVQFVDVKISELISIFTPAPQDEKQEVVAIIKEISPINAAKLKDLTAK